MPKLSQKHSNHVKRQASEQREQPTAADKPLGTAPAAKPVAPDLAAGVDRATQRAAAAAAVAAFYAGDSKPFKPTSSARTFRPLNTSLNTAPTPRQAALLAAIYTYGAGNLQADGTFTRGAFIVPARLAGIDSTDTVRAMPESGCLSNMLGRVVTYVSGATAGRDCGDAIYKLDHGKAKAEIQRFLGDAAARVVDSFIAAPAERAIVKRIPAGVGSDKIKRKRAKLGQAPATIV